MAIESTIKKLVFNDVVVALLLEEVRQKASKSTNEALVICGRLKEKNKKQKMVDPNPMEDLSLLKGPMENVGIVER